MRTSSRTPGEVSYLSPAKSTGDVSFSLADRPRLPGAYNIFNTAYGKEFTVYNQLRMDFTLYFAVHSKAADQIPGNNFIYTQRATVPWHLEMYGAFKGGKWYPGNVVAGKWIDGDKAGAGSVATKFTIVDAGARVPVTLPSSRRPFNRVVNSTDFAWLPY